jgi:two-component sensor histidine kinase/CHASE3 domain sensor protein
MARGSAVVISRPGRQASRERAFRLLAATVAALFATFAVLAGLFLSYDAATRLVMHTQHVRENIGGVLQALSDAEGGQRGYLLTEDHLFLAQIEAARQRAKASVEAVETLTRDNADQQRRVANLRVLMARRLAVVDQTTALAGRGEQAQAIAVIRQGEGIQAMAEVRRLLSALDREEARLEVQRRARARLFRVLAITALATFSLLLTALFIKAIRDINLDREAEAETGEQLRDLVEQRTLLLDEVNRRVKNSLQQIASVVSLQARTADDKETRHALEKTLSRIVAVGRVHEQVYKSGAQVGVFDAGGYAATLARELVDSMGRDDVRLETIVEPADLDMNQAAPLALILNELVTNALKYGCPPDRPGLIRVEFRTDSENCRLSVSDEGTGLPDGFSIASKKSLGMRAVEALARQLDGRLLVEERDAGAAFTVEFPRSAS